MNHKVQMDQRELLIQNVLWSIDQKEGEDFSPEELHVDALSPLIQLTEKKNIIKCYNNLTNKNI